MIYLLVASLGVALGMARHLSERATVLLEVGTGPYDLGKLALPDLILGRGRDWTKRRWLLFEHSLRWESAFSRRFQLG